MQMLKQMLYIYFFLKTEILLCVQINEDGVGMAPASAFEMIVEVRR